MTTTPPHKRKKKARIIRANYLLKAKVGHGEIPEEKIRECQKVIDENKIDFSPMAKEFLEGLMDTIQQTKTKQMTEQEAVKRMTDAVMQLKANASMFHYALVGNLAKVMLGFLETLHKIDADAIEIVDAHRVTLTAIIDKKMHGDGGQYGQQLEKELRGACDRYYRNKRKQKAHN